MKKILGHDLFEMRLRTAALLIPITSDDTSAALMEADGLIEEHIRSFPEAMKRFQRVVKELEDNDIAPSASESTPKVDNSFVETLGAGLALLTVTGEPSTDKIETPSPSEVQHLAHAPAASLSAETAPEEDSIVDDSPELPKDPLENHLSTEDLADLFLMTKGAAQFSEILSSYNVRMLSEIPSGRLSDFRQDLTSKLYPDASH